MSDHLIVQITQLANSAGLPVPHYQTEHAAGVDLYAAVDGSVTVEAGRWKLVPTGIAVAIPEGYEGQVRPRSGLALKHGIGMLNAPVMRSCAICPIGTKNERAGHILS